MRVEGEWTQTGVVAALAQADRWIDAGTLDLSGVHRCDSAGVALLLELTRRARARGKTLTFTQLPTQLEALVQFFGLGEALGI